MAATVKNSLQFFYEILQQEHDVTNDTLKAALMDTTYTFDETTHLAWDASDWVGSTAYTIGDTVKPTTENGYIYKCTSAGTSDSSEPSWPTTIGNTVTDGGVTWECWSVNVSESEVSDGFGYTADGATLSNVSVTKDTSNTRVEINADNPSWTASGGAIPTTGGSIIHNTTHAKDSIVQSIAFSANYDTPDGKVLQINVSDGVRWFQNSA